MLRSKGTETQDDQPGKTDPRSVSRQRYKKPEIQHHNILAHGSISTV